VLELPIPPGERWSLTGGPHYSWNTGSPRGGLDFAPVTGEPACSVSRAWATAAAPGLVVRSANNALAIDLDGDGYEQTGWVVVYVHLAGEGRVPQGTQVKADDPLGHPSCERGVNTGTHVHIARKYNGEWLSADGPIQMTLSGWVVYAGLKNYQGELIKGDQIVTASPVGPRTSIIVR
jgi:murein DD-endopeptidase MepM/ murein hydrolase activator NlpD